MTLPEGFDYRPGVFAGDAYQEFAAALAATLDWEAQTFRIYGQVRPMPRLIAMYGPAGYRYSGVVHPPCPLPPQLGAVRRRVEEVTGRRFNSVLANLYRDGSDSVGWHRDSDYAHGGQPDIASVSFGATRRFEVRDATGRTRAAVDLGDASLLVMRGSCRRPSPAGRARRRRPSGSARARSAGPPDTAAGTRASRGAPPTRHRTRSR